MSNNLSNYIMVLAMFFTLGCISYGQAQDSKLGKIKLNNGTKIKHATNISFEKEYLKADFNGSEEVQIKYDHIKKLRFKGAGKMKDVSSGSLPDLPSLQINTFFHEIRGGLLMGEDHVSASLQTINGYQFNRYLGTGLGAGINTFKQQITMPIYLSAKGYLFDKHVSPFYFGDLGYGFAWNSRGFEGQTTPEKVQGGYYWQIGLGYQINYNSNSLVFTFGYLNQDTKTEYTYQNPWNGKPEKISEQRLHRRFSFTVGFLF